MDGGTLLEIEYRDKIFKDSIELNTAFNGTSKALLARHSIQTHYNIPKVFPKMMEEGTERIRNFS